MRKISPFAIYLAVLLIGVFALQFLSSLQVSDHDSIVEIAILFFAYLLPTIVAFNRHHHQRNAILLTNLLLGWTLIGWLVALIWSATAVIRQPMDTSAA